MLGGGCCCCCWKAERKKHTDRPSTLPYLRIVFHDSWVGAPCLTIWTTTRRPFNEYKYALWLAGDAAAASRSSIACCMYTTRKKAIYLFINAIPKKGNIFGCFSHSLLCCLSEHVCTSDCRLSVVVVSIFVFLYPLFVLKVKCLFHLIEIVIDL